ncbi:monooxygenase [Xylaria arbuscula]|nr:monooxygenase [Xylaria arbuscula]
MPLKVFVVGAGLGGLGAAIALNRAGHDVEVFEQSSFLNEVGAAIHVPPNASRVLKSWGCNLDDLQPVFCNYLNVNGKTPKIHLSSPVLSVSRAVKSVTREELRRTSTGQSCFRFLVPVDKVRANPLTGPLFEKIGLKGQSVFTSHDRRLVIYPCRLGNLLNVVAIHPREHIDDPGRESAYQAHGTMEDLLKTYSEFGPEMVELCKLGEDIKLWSLASRNPAQRFWKGRLALVGDAAHPTLPHQGQGGAQAIEDGAALGVLFPSDTIPEQVSQRLALYNKVRYARAVTVVFMSRTNDEKRSTMMDELRKYIPDAQLPNNMFEYTWDSYPLRDAKRELDSSVKKGDEKISIIADARPLKARETQVV